MNRLLISATHKSSGKTTLSVGLCAALRRRGLSVQAFKKGPDFIDPMWLSLACQRDCHNLDFYLMQRDEILRTFMTRAHGADISLIEGNKGLYDGLSLDGSNSNAALATLLQTPVILVIDARGMTRGIAPLILGQQAFDPNVRIAGVILNQLGGSRHEAKLRAVIEHYTDVPVLGAVHHNDQLTIVERHLGLMPSNEATAAQEKINAIAGLVTTAVDLDRLLAIAADVSALNAPKNKEQPSSRLLPRPHPHSLSREAGEGGEPLRAARATVSLGGRGDLEMNPQEVPSPRPLPLRGRGDLETNPIKIGVARDAAFAFYYPGDLEALRAAGATLVTFDTLRDTRLPEVDALLIGGGFPEVFMRQLETNVSLRQAIRLAIENGMPAYAECGGLMYLSRSLSWHGQSRQMVGVIPGDTVMHERPQGRGYVLLRETGNGLWQSHASPGKPAEVRAHEFHYSSLENRAPDLVYAYDVLRGSGVDGAHDGIVYKNLFACYAHQRDLEDNHWTERFVNFIRARKHGGDKQRAAH